MAIQSYEEFEAWVREQLANGPMEYENLFQAARVNGGESRMPYLRTMAAQGKVKFRLVRDDGGFIHTVDWTGA